MPKPKTIQPIIDTCGKPIATGVSTPKWFVDSKELQVDRYALVSGKKAPPEWGTLFSKPCKGNSVEFYTTGESYFEKVAAAISGARKSVFITGWQINYDVQLTGAQTLFDCLLAAIKNGATIYVLPWQAPPGPVETGYLGTLLAVYHLNAHPEAKGKAYCLPAPVQSDQGTASIGFSHHQKSVIIDNNVAFLGGIDLAYGRRDDANFSLKAGWRKLSEIYNSCVPQIHKTKSIELIDCVTTAELMSAAFTRSGVRTASTFITSPAEEDLARFKDTTSASIRDTVDTVSKKVDNFNQYLEKIDLIKAIKAGYNDVQDKAMDAYQGAVQGAAQWSWERINPGMREDLKEIIRTDCGKAANAETAVFAWLNGADLSMLSPRKREETSKAIHALTFALVSKIHAKTTEKPECYERLFQKIRHVPMGSDIVDTATQPRMPWQDVQCRIKGPSVYDQSRNFVLRWNGSAKCFEDSYKGVHDSTAKFLLDSFGISISPTKALAVRIAAEHQPIKCQPSSGTNWVQILRSASRQMLKDELAGAPDKDGVEKNTDLSQNNCLKGIIQVIGAAQHFLYIEGQFFQSAFGESGPMGPGYSGPIGALLDITRNPNHYKYAGMLGISGLTDPLLMANYLRWAKVDDVSREPQGEEYLHDLKTAIANAAMLKAMRAMGNPQDGLINPVGQAIVNRIERAINDGKPFHVYIVVPVHPEGTLNTLNIMSQIHLTMQSLVFGQNSLVNGVRRAILTHRYRKIDNMSKEEARSRAAARDLLFLVEDVGDRWKDYLTLLNLRNWETIGGRPVTEQIYVHSKLVIADDRVAVLGSANINDRSQLGDRDSEIAAIITDDAKVKIKLDGIHPVDCGKAIHQLRRDLWEKIFGLKSTNRKATSLDGVLDHPAARATWKAIQKIAFDNAQAYEKSFWYIPRNVARSEVQTKYPGDREGGPPASVWPTWHYNDYLAHMQGGQLKYRMPFDPLFWRTPKRGDKSNAWNVAKDATCPLPPENAPGARDIKGFIVELPTRWTYREDNLMPKTHIGAIAQITPAPQSPTDEAVLADSKPMSAASEATA